MWVSEPYTTCPKDGCGSTALTVLTEDWDEIDRVIVGQQQCDVCGALMLYSRKDQAMKKAKNSTRGKQASPKKATKKSAVIARKNVRATVTTHQPNGGLQVTMAVPEPVPVSLAMQQAVEALGVRRIDQDLLPDQMNQLAEAYENVAQEQASYGRKAEAAKIAKKSLDGATEYLLKLVKDFTHPSPLPLFDAPQAEADRKAMTIGEVLDLAPDNLAEPKGDGEQTF